MATIPTIESILFGAYQSAGLNVSSGDGHKKLATVEINRFINRSNIKLEKYQSRYANIIQRLLSVLGSDSDMEINRDLLEALFEFHTTVSHLERSVWTYRASERQVIWTVLSISYIPWIARKAAFWRQEIELAKDIPGGVFWYLPRQSTVDKNILELPVTQVCRWLLKLLGVNNAYAISQLEAKEQAGSMTMDEHDKYLNKKEALKKNIYNWLSGEVTISVKSINNYFADNTEFKLEITTDSGVPLTWRSIRQKFLFAKLVQETYTKLMDMICPDIDYLCTDPAQNKILQLIQLYKKIYQWTEESYRGVSSHSEADQRFIAKLKQHPRAFELNVFDTAEGLGNLDFVAEIITEVLKTSPEDGSLFDVEPWDDQSYMRINSHSQALKDRILSRRTEINNLYIQIQEGHFKHAINSCKSSAALLSLCGDQKQTWKIKQLALERLTKIPLSDIDQFHAINVELSLYLNKHFQKNRQGTQGRVTELLDKAERHPSKNMFKAVILQYQAKHLLSQNRLDKDDSYGDGAIQLFEQALEACEEQGYGPLKGEIARDLLAVILASAPLQKQHETLFRTIIFENVFESNQLFNLSRTDQLIHEMMQKPQPVFEDIAVQCAEFFWESLYRPYAGIPRLRPGIDDRGNDFKQMISVIFNKEWEAYQAWIKGNADLARKRFRDVRGQTLLILLINIRHSAEKAIAIGSSISHSVMDKEKDVLNSFDEAIRLLIEQLPKRAINTNDYKQQSPLMLATNEHLSDIVSMLINKGASLDQQDFKGRTALHAAAATGSLECFMLLIKAGAKPDKTTSDGMNVLHTAVRCGRPQMVKYLIENYPSLKSVPDEYGKLPESYIGIHKFEEWEQFCKENDRHIGSATDYLEIEKLFSDKY